MGFVKEQHDLVMVKRKTLIQEWLHLSTTASKLPRKSLRSLLPMKLAITLDHL